MSSAARTFDQPERPTLESRVLEPDEIGIFIRTRRELQGWSQDTLATLSGLSIRTIQRVEDGQPSSVDTKRALARAFQFDDIDFFSNANTVPDEVQFRKLMDERDQLNIEKNRAEELVRTLTSKANNVQMILNLAAAQDLRWLHIVRTTLMPKQDSRVPFHNAAEIAMRGYHCSIRGRPILKQVTWSLLPYNEGGLHRGYHAGLIFTGSDFAPGVTWTSRFKDSSQKVSDLGGSWRQPNIYFGDRLETSTHADPEEGPVSWRGMEFSVRNPEGQTSDWIEFSYPFDDEKLLLIMEREHRQGVTLLQENRAAESIEHLRKAMIFSRAIFGWGAEKYLNIEKIWNQAIDQAARDKLRFREGTVLKIISGPHEGKVGTVEKILPRHFHAYLIGSGTDEKIQAADDQVETHGASTAV